MERFDKVAADKKPDPVTNGHVDPVPEPAPTALPVQKEESPEADNKTGIKRKSESQEEDSKDDLSEPLSDTPSSPPPKKKRKPEVEDDAAFAARLQAEEMSRARPTRGGNQRKTTVVKKKKKTPKKKTSDKVKAEDDSDLEGSGSGGERKVNRNSGFHVWTSSLTSSNSIR